MYTTFMIPSWNNINGDSVERKKEREKEREWVTFHMQKQHIAMWNILCEKAVVAANKHPTRLVIMCCIRNVYKAGNNNKNSCMMVWEQVNSNELSENIEYIKVLSGMSICDMVHGFVSINTYVVYDILCRWVDGWLNVAVWWKFQQEN